MIAISFVLDSVSSEPFVLDVMTDSKFKTGSVIIRLLTPYDDESSAALALLPAILCSATAKYPTDALLAKRLNQLYGASLTGACLHCSDMLELVFSTDFILDRYALDGESVSLEATNILLDCLFDPLVVDGTFDETEFNMRKQDLLDNIDAEINDKASYALGLALETAYEGEIRSKRYYGSREAVESLTPESCYAVYRKIFSISKIYASVCSGERMPQIEKLLTETLSQVACPVTLPDYYSFSKAKPEPKYITQPVDAKQSNLVLAFKTDVYDRFANNVLSALYGESSTAKLFENVRERLSLCYYCQSVYSPTKATMFVLSAVDNANIDKATAEIINQLNLIATGDFGDDELQDAKLYLVSVLRAKFDRKGAISDWTFSEKLVGSNMSIQEAIENINRVGRADVINAARAFKLDTVFCLEGAADA